MSDYTNMAGRNNAEQKKVWLKRNNKFIKRLEKGANNDNVVAMVMAIELVLHLIEYTNLIVVTEFENSDEEAYGVKSDLENKKYGIRIIVDIYQPSGRVNFIYRKHRNNIRFVIPCVCGFFNDEEHNFNLK